MMKSVNNNQDASLESIKSKIIDFFASHNNVVSVFLFGSIVAGNMDDESDIDIAIIYDNQEEYKKIDLIHMRSELYDLIGRDVDIVCLNLAPVILRMQVFMKGIKLFDRNPKITNTLIVRSQFEYDDLKYVRTPIERQILKGRIYGRS